MNERHSEKGPFFLKEMNHLPMASILRGYELVFGNYPLPLPTTHHQERCLYANMYSHLVDFYGKCW